MREILHLPRELSGDLWSYSFHGHSHWMHHHAELEVNLVTRGTGRYLVGDRRYDLRPGTQIWLFPRQDHLLLDQSPDLRMWIILFKPQLLTRLCRRKEDRVLLAGDPAGQFCVHLTPEPTAGIGAVCQQLREARADAGRFNAGLGYLLLSCWAAHRSAEQSHAGRSIHPAVEKAAWLLRDDSRAMKLEELARRCGLSASRLSRLFKRQTGVTLVNYRQKQCLERFLKLHGDAERGTMMQTALEAGFGSYPQFHRVFKQYMGCTPAEYGQGGSLRE